ncbi:Hpt domain-containing protein [Treponema sp. HNW]|uniref:Hpt domain-containing protein n=1 Tax=Treponema sp. HNW TaxID=3116654 RepID=UPI003D0A2A56
MEQSLVDYKKAISDLGNDSSLYKELLDCWFSELPFDKNVLNAFIEKSELSEAASYVHRIKGAAGSLGALNLFQAAQKVEDILRGRSADALTAHVKNLYDLYDRTNAEFRELQNSIG